MNQIIRCVKVVPVNAGVVPCIGNPDRLAGVVPCGSITQRRLVSE
jgi:hypothetical protein